MSREQREAIEVLTPAGGGVSRVQAEKTRAMLRDYLQWKDGRRREMTQQLPLALFELETPTPHRPVEAAVRVAPASGLGEDRAVAVPTENGYLVAVADGAGGTGNGAAAAERVVTALTKLAGVGTSTDWFDALCAIDDEVSASGGETTGVVAFIDRSRIVGASVGDSSAWLVSPAGEITDLTARQRRRPLLGSGEALPVQFEAELNGGRLLLASDGLVKYATVELICALAHQGSIAEAANAFANCVRLPSGSLQDDVAVVLLG